MTSVSGVSSSSSTSGSTGSQLSAAKSALGALLTSNAMLGSLDTSGSSTKTPTATQVLSVLLSLINPDNARTVTKSDVQQAVTSLGGSASTASAIWSQIAPPGSNNISAAGLKNNTFLISTINADMPKIQTSFSAYASSSLGIAGNTMTQLLTSNDVTQALSTQSSTYLPPTTDQVFSTLWALFDVNGANTINEKDVQQAVLAEGGKPSQANALWAQLDPSGNGSISATAFITNKYLSQALPANLPAVQASVKTIQQQAGPGTSTDLLGSFLSEGGSGSLISDVGGGDNTTTLMDILA